ncbi:hypothetical protein AAFF_G00099600 [Aldrovandia affinis]|uniref:Uncharacterized protein n=1 Tax=Aldrovandia affinis TaxID=143900 RepID=A0AAD7RVA0_9TELE|nr:hypothetical protein AAFF_G00099600 [Aldrovandia affinis]
MAGMSTVNHQGPLNERKRVSALFLCSQQADGPLCQSAAHAYKAPGAKPLRIQPASLACLPRWGGNWANWGPLIAQPGKAEFTANTAGCELEGLELIFI